MVIILKYLYKQLSTYFKYLLLIHYRMYKQIGEILDHFPSKALRISAT